MSAQWTEELFDKMSAQYVAKINDFPEDERPGVSMELVTEIAKEHKLTANGFRIKLAKAGLYIKKEAGKATAGTGGAKEKTGGAGRTSKAAAHAELLAAFSDAGLPAEELDAEIIDKLTGKAAAHLAEAIRKITK